MEKQKAFLKLVMALINFSREDFIKAVEKGTKHFTVRFLRKNPLRKGESLQLYTGLRTKHARKLRDTVCKNIWELKIVNKKDKFLFYLDGKELPGNEIKDIGNRIGFNSTEDWVTYFKEKYKFPFRGQLIEWE